MATYGDININVRLQQYKGTPTSSGNSIVNKSERTSPAKSRKARASGKNTGVMKTKSAFQQNMGTLQTGMKKGGLTSMTILAAMKATGKILNTYSRVQGNVTGNRFRETRKQTFARTLGNPFQTVRDIVQMNYERYFELNREFERLDYKREIAGMSLPYRHGNTGMSL